jgi:hypothetical protein
MRTLRFARLAALAAVLAAVPACSQQVPDTTFDVSIAHPAWEAGKGPRLVLDEAHFNFHTLTGRYRPFGSLARSDGFRVAAGTMPFTRESLAGCDLLVIANALGAGDMSDSTAERPAFTDTEVGAVVAWVQAGGSLLLIADHAPMGSAAAPLGRALGVDMRCAYTLDPLQGGKSTPSLVSYTPGQGLDTSCVIVRGRPGDPPVRRVLAFTGQSLAGPPGAMRLLALSDEAYDAMVSYRERGRIDDLPADRRKSAAGRAQGVAFELGSGRVVVLGEAAMMSAQLAGPGGRIRMGMNAPGNDDRQFAINVLRWLGRKL